MKQDKYSEKDLFGLGPQKTFSGLNLKEISFPLGGIGTGSIGLSGSGGLKDFEIFNRPNIGSKFPMTFPIIRVKSPESNPIARILKGPLLPPYTPLDGGRYKANGEGFPHMDSAEFRGEYPFAYITFKSKILPVNVQLEAFNPFIPSDPDGSGYPIAVLKYKVSNSSNAPVDVSILWSLLNIVGFSPDDCLLNMIKGNHLPPGKFLNTYFEEGQIKGLIFSNLDYPEDHHRTGSIALSSPDENVGYTPYWKLGPWFSAHYHLWNTFKQQGELHPYHETPPNHAEPGALSIKKTIQPGQVESFTFYISWYMPNVVKYWENWDLPKDLSSKPSWQNYYASQFDDALDVAFKFHQNVEYLYKFSKSFHDSLFQSTLPPYVLEAIAGNMSILKTTTCLRLSDGTFYGFEGCHPDSGCCEGSCNHVWGYQQTLPFLFPSLERSMREADYKYNFNFDDCGAMAFRLQLPLGKDKGLSIACADGQFGGIIHGYREWKISGDDDWLRKMWPSFKRALEFAFEEWDEEKSGVLRDYQHNTYDVNFLGPNSMLTGYYLGALLAAAEMAEFVGEDIVAKNYREIFNRGRIWVDKNLFNGEYYVQLYDPAKGINNQVGSGCLIDQLVGQQLAYIAGLPRFLNDNYIKSALASIFRYNWKSNMRDYENGARLYAVNDEAATIICTWPKGGRPEIPFPYADEVMNGFEYQFGIHCLLEGMLEEGLTVIKSIRDRFDGFTRNPWDEFECGHHYARSMAAYGSLIALSGFEYDKGNGYLAFDPKINRDVFQTFWALDGVWGNFQQTGPRVVLNVLYGAITIKKLKLPIFTESNQIHVKTPSKSVEIHLNSPGIIEFSIPVKLKENQSIELT